ncbi:hypothetical protein [Paraburkholderia sp. J12]|uniref:hypothetical protein n=1 Tax=Paraburkholderia sp. J12 TaxID=2805432 RepID=UPI002ABD3FD8|nr:hypothetical protein [Paraburkholderia sp. J12]
MWVVGVGLILNLVACVAVFSHLLHHVGNQPAAMFFATFLVMWAFFIIGFIMQLAGKVKMGAALLTIGSIVLVVGSFTFLPIGPLVFLAALAGIVTIVGALRRVSRGGARVVS